MGNQPLTLSTCFGIQPEPELIREGIKELPKSVTQVEIQDEEKLITEKNKELPKSVTQVESQDEEIPNFDYKKILEEYLTPLNKQIPELESQIVSNTELIVQLSKKCGDLPIEQIKDILSLRRDLAKEKADCDFFKPEMQILSIEIAKLNGELQAEKTKIEQKSNEINTFTAIIQQCANDANFLAKAKDIYNTSQGKISFYLQESMYLGSMSDLSYGRSFYDGLISNCNTLSSQQQNNMRIKLNEKTELQTNWERINQKYQGLNSDLQKKNELFNYRTKELQDEDKKLEERLNKILNLTGYKSGEEMIDHSEQMKRTILSKMNENFELEKCYFSLQNSIQAIELEISPLVKMMEGKEKEHTKIVNEAKYKEILGYFSANNKNETVSKFSDIPDLEILNDVLQNDESKNEMGFSEEDVILMMNIIERKEKTMGNEWEAEFMKGFNEIKGNIEIMFKESLNNSLLLK